MHVVLQRLLLFALIFNPLSLFFVLLLFVLSATLLIASIITYAIFTTTRDFLISQWHPYLEPETIQQLEQLRLSLQIRSWNESVLGLPKQPGQDISQPPKWVKDYPSLVKIVLFVPLTVYMTTRLLTHSFLTLVQFYLQQLYYGIPKLFLLGRRLYLRMAQQILWLRSLFAALVYPIWQFFYPLLLTVFQFLLDTALSVLEWFFVNVPLLILFVHRKTKKYTRQLLHLIRNGLQTMYTVTKEFYVDKVEPILEQSKQIWFRVYPHLKKWILTLVALCESLDNRIRPILKQWMHWTMKNINWFVLVGWTIVRIFWISVWSLLTWPFQLSRLLFEFGMQLTREIFKFLKPALERIQMTVLRQYHAFLPVYRQLRDSMIALVSRYLSIVSHRLFLIQCWMQQTVKAIYERYQPLVKQQLVRMITRFKQLLNAVSWQLRYFLHQLSLQSKHYFTLLYAQMVILKNQLMYLTSEFMKMTVQVLAWMQSTLLSLSRTMDELGFFYLVAQLQQTLRWSLLALARALERL